MIWINFLLALRGLLSYKFRVFLTTLGIIMAITAVMVMASIIEGAKRESLEIMATMGGPSNIIIYPKFPEEKDVIPLGLLYGDALSIRNRSPFIEGVSPTINNWVGVKYKDKQTQEVNGLGCWPEFLNIAEFEIKEGRFITWDDVEANHQVIVLGYITKQDLFGHTSPIGEKIEIEGRMYKVVGVLKKKIPKGWSSEGIKWLNRRYCVPITTFWQEKDIIHEIHVKVKHINLIEDAFLHIKSILLARHNGVDEFDIHTAKGALENIRQGIKIWILIMGAIVGISLLIGGIGIMNTMLATVSDRKKEIGIRRSVGAKEIDILFQFLMEAVIISVSAGLVGIGLGMGIIQLVGLVIVNVEGPVKTVIITPFIVGLAILVSSLVGILFGVYPAYKAARQNPIDALRYE